jgi:hypothetical protein
MYTKRPPATAAFNALRFGRNERGEMNHGIDAVGGREQLGSISDVSENINSI